MAGVGPSNMDNDIELNHFYTLVQDRGVPARYCTVFHTDVDIAKHEPVGYEHAEATIHPVRFEIDDDRFFLVAGSRRSLTLGNGAQSAV
jgi:hypothetical protein